MAQIHGSRCRTVFNGGKFSGIAVGKKSVTGFYKTEAVFAYGFAYAYILVSYFDGLFSEGFHYFGYGLFTVIFHYFSHTLKCPGKIDCCRTGGIQISRRFFKLLVEIFKAVCLYFPCGEIYTHSGCYAYGGSPSYLKQINGVPYLLLSFKA